MAGTGGDRGLRIRRALDELEALARGGGYADAQALSRFETLVRQLGWDEDVPESAKPKLAEALRWARILYSQRKHRQWDTAVVDGASQVRGWTMAAVSNARWTIERGGGNGSNTET